MGVAAENSLVFLDSETTSLNTRLGDVIEAAWAVDRGMVQTIRFPHTLEHADPQALAVNRYYERGLDRLGSVAGYTPRIGGSDAATYLIRALQDNTVVAENYGFDIAMLGRKLGFEPWHYRKIELSSVALTVFDLDRPEGISATASRLRDLGYEIPYSDHSAEADVECLRACYYSLREVRSRHGYPKPAAAARGVFA